MGWARPEKYRKVTADKIKHFFMRENLGYDLIPNPKVALEKGFEGLTNLC